MCLCPFFRGGILPSKPRIDLVGAVYEKNLSTNGDIPLSGNPCIFSMFTDDITEL